MTRSRQGRREFPLTQRITSKIEKGKFLVSGKIGEDRGVRDKPKEVRVVNGRILEREKKSDAGDLRGGQRVVGTNSFRGVNKEHGRKDRETKTRIINKISSDPAHWGGRDTEGRRQRSQTHHIKIA